MFILLLPFTFIFTFYSFFILHFVFLCLCYVFVIARRDCDCSARFTGTPHALHALCGQEGNVTHPILSYFVISICLFSCLFMDLHTFPLHPFFCSVSFFLSFLSCSLCFIPMLVFILFMHSSVVYSCCFFYCLSN